MTTDKPTDIVDEMLDKTSEHLAYLRARWNDEKEYESFDDYVQSMKKLVDTIEGVEFVSMSKRPFGFRWRAKADGTLRETRLERSYANTYRVKELK